MCLNIAHYLVATSGNLVFQDTVSLALECVLVDKADLELRFASLGLSAGINVPPPLAHLVLFLLGGSRNVINLQGYHLSFWLFFVCLFSFCFVCF